jgi:hypothetical protein
VSKRNTLANLSLIISLLLGSTSAYSRQTNISPVYVNRPTPTGLDLMSDIREFGDVLRETDRIGGLLDDPALTNVTREFGHTVITARELPMRSGVVAANLKPWSSWWFPKKDDFLFKNYRSTLESPLAKYDLIRRMKYQMMGRTAPKSAADYEYNNYNPNSLSWEGLCDAWALASISKPEPKKPVSYRVGNTIITFTVGDLKALMLKTFEATDDSGLKYYGQKFSGDYSGWIYPDMFPDQFHRFLEVQLFERKQPFVMDHDPGVEIWNVPVYKANYLIESVPNEPNSVFVRTWLYSAESVRENEKDFLGTREAVREYNYVLKGSRNGNGDLVIESGYWVKGPDGVDSRKNHPDYLAIAIDPSRLVRKSWNPELEIDLVDEILSKSY